ncbi:hypothetical protein DFR74_103121 [Nocardia puris]|uniref:Uncharacterized protein n=1 Tax=Nocardia puris TaxID=208602 RepID=A0A366DTE4_9NOCA|nr:hypothetical protein DFR74_103121 [Nocardia puris]
MKDLPDCRFDAADLPLPWTGELYAESHDRRTMYRLYFIEARPTWMAVTDEVVASGIGAKPAWDDPDWSSEVQTRQIHDAMLSGVTRCGNVRKRWRRWDSA